MLFGEKFHKQHRMCARALRVQTSVWLYVSPAPAAQLVEAITSKHRATK